jgi:hypothetical protein
VHEQLFPKIERRAHRGKRRLVRAMSLFHLAGQWKQLDRCPGVTDDERAKAKEALAHVGVTDDVFAELDALFGLASAPPRSPPAPAAPDRAARDRAAPDRAARDRAEADLWAWYLQWSTTAREVIADRGLLRQLGFLRERIAARGVGERVGAAAV